MHHLPYVIDVFLQPLRDNPQAQVAVIAVLLLIVLDVLFGLGNAFLHHEYDSSKMREGLAHKAVELCFILLACILDATIIAGIELGFTAPVLVTICVYLIVMEIGSLMETFTKIWPSVADWPFFKLLKSAHVIKIDEVGLDD
ncbi:MAG: phage holin family protein [Eggerthellaceae bacterium]|nr:phage holin family protein [Eggerthellaceae bacterium]MBQ3342678.1 phage holin family protein [Kiritimatiellia bacterium]